MYWVNWRYFGNVYIGLCEKLITCFVPHSFIVKYRHNFLDNTHIFWVQLNLSHRVFKKKTLSSPDPHLTQHFFRTQIVTPTKHHCMKRQKDRTLKDGLPRLAGAQYAAGDQWRNNSRKNEETEVSGKPWMTWVKYDMWNIAGNKYYLLLLGVCISACF